MQCLRRYFLSLINTLPLKVFLFACNMYYYKKLTTILGIYFHIINKFEMFDKMIDRLKTKNQTSDPDERFDTRHLSQLTR